MRVSNWLVASLVAFIAGGFVAWLICRQPTGDTNRGQPTSPMQSRLARLRRHHPAPVDPGNLTLQSVRSLVRSGDFARVDFDPRFWKIMGSQTTLKPTMEDASPVPAECYPEVVMIQTDPNTELNCTGTIISDHAVLTASHCFDGKDPKCFVLIGACPRTVTKTLQGIAHCFGGRCNPTPVLGVPDVAVVTVSETFTTKPRDLAAIGLSAGAVVLAVGRGDDGYGLGTPRMAEFAFTSDCHGSVPLGSAIPDPLYYDCDPATQFVAARPASGASVCSGDSGGPVMLESDGFRIAAVIAANGGSCKTASVFTRIDTTDVQTFIKSIAGKPTLAFTDQQCMPPSGTKLASITTCN